MKRPLCLHHRSVGARMSLRTPKTPPSIAGLVYDAGFSPVCPASVSAAVFEATSIPQEHKDGIDMARDYLRRASCAGGLRRYGG